MNQTIQGIVIVLSLILLLKLYFKVPDLEIVVMILLGLFSGILGQFFVGFVKPSRALFRFRFILYGIGLGIMIGLPGFFTDSIENQTFNGQDLIIDLLISLPLGVIILGSITYYRFRQLKKKTKCNTDNQNAISDFAIYKGADNKKIRGRLLLSNNTLSFYSQKNSECLFERALADITPEIRKTNFMNIPSGISLQNDMSNVSVAFPYFWMQEIEARKRK